MDLDELRNCINESISCRLYKSALFYSEKLILLSPPNEDLYTHCSLLYSLKKYHRVLFFLEKHDLTYNFPTATTATIPNKIIEDSFQFLLLTLQCLNKTKQYTKVFDLLDVNAKTLREAFPPFTSYLFSLPKTPCKAKGILSSVCIEIAKAHLKLNHVIFCRLWNINALQYNLKCVEVIDFLRESKMLTMREQRDLYTQISGRGCSAVSKWALNCLENGYSRQNTVTNSLEDYLFRIEHSFEAYCLENCVKMTMEAIEKFGYRKRLCLYHIAALFESNNNAHLFHFIQQIIQKFGKSSLVLYAIGIYYLLASDIALAKKFFAKSTHKNEAFGPALIAFGHVYSQEGMNNESINAYLCARRAMPGSYLPSLYIGMEHLRSRDFSKALHFLRDCERTIKKNPLILNELGVAMFFSGKYREALTLFKAAEECISALSSEIVRNWGTVFLNIGHAYRKIRMFDVAIEYYEKAMVYLGEEVDVYLSMGFVLHLMGRMDEGIDFYHRATSIDPQNKLVEFLLGEAIVKKLETDME